MWLERKVWKEGEDGPEERGHRPSPEPREAVRSDDVPGDVQRARLLSVMIQNKYINFTKERKSEASKTDLGSSRPSRCCTRVLRRSTVFGSGVWV